MLSCTHYTQFYVNLVDCSGIHFFVIDINTQMLKTPVHIKDAFQGDLHEINSYLNPSPVIDSMADLPNYGRHMDTCIRKIICFSHYA